MSDVSPGLQPWAAGCYEEQKWKWPLLFLGTWKQHWGLKQLECNGNTFYEVYIYNAFIVYSNAFMMLYDCMSQHV